MTSRSADVLIVGGGVIGCAAAYELAREGLSVRLLERGVLAGESSGAAAGMLTPVGEALHSPTLARWGFESLSRFPELCSRARELSGVDPELEHSGALRVARGERDAAELQRLRAELCNERPELEWLSAQAARELEPQLAEEQHGCLWSPREAHVRSGSFTRALAGAAVALGAQLELGVTVRGLLRAGERVVGVQTSGAELRAGYVIVCSGAWVGELQDWLGEIGLEAPPLPVVPVRGQILALDVPRPPLRSIVWGGDTYLVPRRDGSLVVGATEERAGFECHTTTEGVARLLSSAPRLVPALAGVPFREAWVGLRPSSPDGLPAIAAIEGAPGLAVAAGHFRNGILLAPVTAELLRDLVIGKARPRDLADFDPKRWQHT